MSSCLLCCRANQKHDASIASLPGSASTRPSSVRARWEGPSERIRVSISKLSKGSHGPRRGLPSGRQMCCPGGGRDGGRLRAAARSAPRRSCSTSVWAKTPESCQSRSNGQPGKGAVRRGDRCSRRFRSTAGLSSLRGFRDSSWRRGHSLCWALGIQQTTPGTERVNACEGARPARCNVQEPTGHLKINQVASCRPGTSCSAGEDLVDRL